MFFEKYLDDYYLDELINNYDINYLKNLDKENFEIIYNLFKNYNFYFIEDIILGYIEIFEMKKELVEEKIIALNKVLGNDFVNKIGEDMSYLEYIVR